MPEEVTDADSVVASTEYFRVHGQFGRRGGRIFARIQVLRQDTDEVIKEGFVVTGADEDIVRSEAKQRVESELIPRLKEIGVPEGWNTQVRQVLARIGRVNRLILSGKTKLDQDGSDLGVHFDSSEEYCEFWTALIRESVSISAEIEKLSSEERSSLLVSPDWVFDDPSDHFSLADLDARHRAFSFFREPSAAERKVHEAQSKRLAARFDELGWD